MRHVVPLLAVLSLAFAPAPFPKPARRPASVSIIEGQWEGAHLLEITRGHATYGGAREYELRVNASANPPTFDLRGLKPASVAGRELHGIYKAEGDVLTLCYHSAGRERPTAFTGPGQGTYTATYNRKKR